MSVAFLNSSLEILDCIIGSKNITPQSKGKYLSTGNSTSSHLPRTDSETDCSANAYLLAAE
ncbi:hypothetical protein OROMI_018237 [Orobanche minor]